MGDESGRIAVSSRTLSQKEEEEDKEKEKKLTGNGERARQCLLTKVIKPAPHRKAKTFTEFV